MPSAQAEPVSAEEAAALFSDLKGAPALVLAVSGGPDSTALMVLAARWRAALRRGPKLVAVTIDHGLRPEAKKEAAAVGKLARKLKLAHRTLRWTGRKPKTGLQQAARAARYRLLAAAALKAHAPHVLTAHTRDDQAETVLIRMSRGSGVSGLGGMNRIAPVPGAARLGLFRPLLDVPKARLLATLAAAGIPHADDPSNRDPRFTRARLRGLMPALAAEGLTAARLAQLARRLRRADGALEAMTDAAAQFLVRKRRGSLVFEPGWDSVPDEIALRLLRRAIAAVGTEGPVELAKLESLQEALDTARNAGSARFRRSLAGAIVTWTPQGLTVEPAPPRRSRALTTGAARAARRGKPR
ncbi:MAG: tRNA lysidine(34) synthetase TilS [Pseudolabrys sp.]